MSFQSFIYSWCTDCVHAALSCLPASASATSMKELRKVVETASTGGENRNYNHSAHIDWYSNLKFISIYFISVTEEKASLTFEVEQRHCEAAFSYFSMKVVRGQLGDGVHVQHVASVVVNRPRNFIIQFAWRQINKHINNNNMLWIFILFLI